MCDINRTLKNILKDVTWFFNQIVQKSNSFCWRNQREKSMKFSPRSTETAARGALLVAAGK